MARAHGHWRKCPEEWVVDGVAAVAPILEATWVLDELGYLPTLPGFGPALYELIAGRYERRPTLITSNKSLTEWAAIVQDASLAAALVDRILHHGEVNVFNELRPPVH